MDRLALPRLPRLVAVLLALALGAPGAAAAAPLSTIPADAPVVAGPTPSGATLVAWQHGDQLCTAGRPGPAGGEAKPPDCEDVPILPPLGHRVLDNGFALVHGRPLTTVAGVTGTDVASVDLRTRRNASATAATTPSPFSGALAELRFFLVEQPTEEVAELRLLDASGQVRRADGRVGDAFFGSDSLGRKLAAGRRHGVPWRLGVTTERRLAPTPLEPLRRTPLVCVTLHLSETEGGGPCADPTLPGDTLALSGDLSCGPLAGTVIALARAPIRIVTVVFGDGRRERLRLLPIHDAGADLHAGLLLLDPGIAIRRVVAADAAGHALTVVRLGQAPLPRSCGAAEAAGGFFTVVDDGQASTVGGGAHRVAAADRDALLCAGVDAPPRNARACGIPPIEPDGARLSAARTPTGRFVWGIVPVDVAAARLVFDDGTTLDVPAAPIAGYTGRYAAVERAVEATVGDARRVVAYRFLDARGRVLDASPGPELAPLQHVATILRVPGVPPLEAAEQPMGAQPLKPLPCLTLGSVRASCEPATEARLSVRAQCAPRRIVIYGLLARGDTSLTVALADGRTVRGRMARVPAASGGGTAVLLVLPRDAAPRTIVVRGRHPRHPKLELPPAREQCGYESSLAIDPQLSDHSPSLPIPSLSSASLGSATRSSHGSARAAAG